MTVATARRSRSQNISDGLLRKIVGRLYVPMPYWKYKSCDGAILPLQRVLVSFGMGIHSSRRSFPRKRIQSGDGTLPKLSGVDSRFRGNDQVSQMTPIRSSGVRVFFDNLLEKRA